MLTMGTSYKRKIVVGDTNISLPRLFLAFFTIKFQKRRKKEGK